MAVAPADRAVGVSERDVDGAPLVVEGLAAAGGPVHELVGDGQPAGAVRGVERAHRGRGQDLPDAQRAQRPQVGPVRDLVRGEAVITAVPGHERDLPARHLAGHDGVAGHAVGGVHADLVGGLQELIEAGSADHADLGAGQIGQPRPGAADLRRMTHDVCGLAHPARLARRSEPAAQDEAADAELLVPFLSPDPEDDPDDPDEDEPELPDLSCLSPSRTRRTTRTSDESEEPEPEEPESADDPDFESGLAPDGSLSFLPAPSLPAPSLPAPSLPASRCGCRCGRSRIP